MTKEFFEEVMKIPSVSGHEDMMQEFLMKWGPKHGCNTRKDGKGNVYMTKGSAKFYPTFINHIDTVHHDQQEMVKEKVYKEIIWDGDHVTAKNTITGKQTGLGMDNQGGACIALAVLDKLPAAKAIFTVEEEIGMQGIKGADMKFFDDAAFVISNDSPDTNRATHYSSGVQLYSDDFFTKHLQPICLKHGLTSFRSEPWTCIKIVRENWTDKDGKHIECLNFGNAGDRPHSDQEGASWKGVNAAEETLFALATGIPTDVQHVSDMKTEPRPVYNWPGKSSAYASAFDFDDDYDDDEGLVPTYKDRDDTDMCTILLAFDDEEQFNKFAELIDSENVAVNLERKDETDITTEVFGELGEMKKAYILWYQLFYDMPQVKTWEQLVADNGDIDFDNDVIFEEPYVGDSYSPDIPDVQGGFHSKDEVDDFWNWINSRK